MSRIGSVGRVGAVQVGQPRVAVARTDAAVPTVQALVVLDGGRRDEPRPAWHAGAARPCAGFVTQLLVAAETGLRPSRLERTRTAAAHYAETARRLA